ncbi:MAG TPA: L-threonate dehydrogenase [Acetobacteraceae bacterium]|jgi:putative dehydrogenase|nr:L-threonate dehydrogenase [Acetobacteraceae bacterium]
MKVGVIGLGTMGMGVALNLHRKGHRVIGCELREASRAEFIAAGATAVATPAELPTDLDAVVVFVINAAQTEQVLFGAQAGYEGAGSGGCLERLNQGAVILCCATIAPDAAKALGARITAAGFLMLDAPVSGGKAGAHAGTMTVMGAGSDAAFAKARPVLDAISSKVWQLGTEPGVGSTVKMVNQLLAGVHIATAAEALALGIRAGADPKTLFEVISASAGSSWMWQNRVPHVLAGDDTPLSAVNIFVKDLGIVLDQARALTFPLPLAAAAHQLFLAAAAHGEGAKDDVFVIRVWQALTGIDLPKKPDGD